MSPLTAKRELAQLRKTAANRFEGPSKRVVTGLLLTRQKLRLL